MYKTGKLHSRDNIFGMKRLTSGLDKTLLRPPGRPKTGAPAASCLLLLLLDQDSGSSLQSGELGPGNSHTPTPTPLAVASEPGALKICRSAGGAALLSAAA